ncbi:DUF5947 family protein [Candidatus Mycolicibacterium alkanivorans]|uniref:DUF5947 family protein n=1 Tax=Candidatus Mycolicibacterium alkanivorans TaxID=2954114 RepID=A0ABS9YZK8_9MYCO|nr:DUF5947 family protein [Candidatus Mycolicibacterium alkanivorans]MCI4676678.1 DUF5947 family protein [Candidatus Mycolicibacterium alkanivorans]
MTSTLEVLSRIRTGRTAPQPVGERCEMCASPVADEHQHVVNVAARQLMCVCRACYLLFTDASASLRYRAVPDRFLYFPDFGLGRRAWDALQIPVGVAFFFRNSALDRTVAFYPGPAGATESELDTAAWAAATCDPRVGLLADDVEALLVRVPDDPAAPESDVAGIPAPESDVAGLPAPESDVAGLPAPECFLVPIDACYEFVGGLRLLWRGFDGGAQARDFIDGFFAGVAERSVVQLP